MLTWANFSSAKIQSPSLILSYHKPNNTLTAEFLILHIRAERSGTLSYQRLSFPPVIWVPLPPVFLRPLLLWLIYNNQYRVGKNIDLQLWVCKTEFILVLLFINYCIILNMNNCKPTVPHPVFKDTEEGRMAWALVFYSLMLKVLPLPRLDSKRNYTSF